MPADTPRAIARPTAPDWAALKVRLLGAESVSLLPPNVVVPAMPEALTRFNRRAAQPDATAAELGRIVDGDTALTCELLKVVNSAAVGLRNRVATGGQAVALLGIRRTQTLLVSTAVQSQAATANSPLLYARMFCRSNLERAAFARVVAVRLGADADLAFAAGLTQDFLLSVLTRELRDRYFTLIGRLTDGSGRDLAALERDAFRWDHAEAAARVMAGWGFPDDLACCVALHHAAEMAFSDPALCRSAAAAGALAACLPDRIGQTPDGPARLAALTQRLELDLPAVVAEADALLAELAPSADAPLAQRLSVAA